jgi:transaldolase
MSQNRCLSLRQAGTAVWLDQLSREMIIQGRLQALLTEAALTGLTSNPAIFHKAMTGGQAYDAQIAELRSQGLGVELLYEHLAVTDIRMACDVLHPVWAETHGADGFVSLEVSPHLARDTQGTLAAARRLSAWVDRPNLLIKVPGTAEGLPAIEQLLEEGMGINVTLLFAVETYEAVAQAFVRALGRRLAAGKSTAVPSVASFFISRIDTLVDSRLEQAAGKAASAAARDELLALRGQAAVANAKIAYRSFRRIFRGSEFTALAAQGARVQRPLWASTSTKNPAYRDVLYVEPLIGRDTVNTMPAETIAAFLDHGRTIPDTVEADLAEAERHLHRLEQVGISFHEITETLLENGIAKFNEPYDQLLQSLDRRRQA